MHEIIDGKIVFNRHGYAVGAIWQPQPLRDKMSFRCKRFRDDKVSLFNTIEEAIEFALYYSK